MKICLVTPEYPPAPKGGIGTYAWRWADLLAQAGHEVHVVTKLWKDEPEFEHKGQLYVHRLIPRNPVSGKSAFEDPDKTAVEMIHVRHYCALYALAYAEAVRRIIEKYGIDIIETSEIEAPLYFFLTRQMMEKGFPQTPVVTFVHGPFEDCQRYNDDLYHDPRSRYRIHLENFSMSASDGLVVASRAMADLVEKKFGPAEGRMLLCHLPTMLSSPEKLPGEAEGKDEVILYVGRLEKRKGVDTLMRAVLPILRERPQARLRLIGRDTEFSPYAVGMKEWMSRLIPEELSGRVEFLGELPHDQVAAHYRRARVVVLPSRWEPYGLTCQEAMSQGALVVASRGTGYDEMVQDGVNGLSFTPDSARDLREVLGKALSLTDEERLGMRQAGFTSIQSLDDPQVILEKRLEHFRQVIAWRAEARRPRAFPSNAPLTDIPLREPHPRSKAPSLGSAPRLSVIVPCYNLGQFLGECVESLLKQTRPPEEILIVDDGSTEAATVTEVDRWGKASPLVKVVRTENAGLPSARNTGASLATGEVLCFLDADDWLAPTYFENALYVLTSHPEVGAVTAWADSFGAMNTMWAPPHSTLPDLVTECMSAPPAVVRADAFREAGGFASEVAYAYEDWDLWLTLCASGWMMATLPAGHIHYRIRPNSMSRSFRAATVSHGRRMLAERHKELYKRFASEIALLCDLRAQPYQAFGQGQNQELQASYGKLEAEVFVLREMVERYRSIPRHPLRTLKWISRRALARLLVKNGK